MKIAGFNLGSMLGSSIFLSQDIIMWFNNALVYEYEDIEFPELASTLNEERLRPCPPHARFVYGWLPAHGDELVVETAGASLICLGKEERLLPRGVVNRMVGERVQMIEAQQGRQVKRTERTQIAEEVEFDLLPKSFCVQKRLLALIDTQSKRLIINTASETQATQLIASLRKSISGLKLDPLFHTDNLALRFVDWINNPQSLPAPFQLASDCLLFSLSDEKKRISCKGYELPADEVVSLLTQGLAVSELSLIWNERIQFTLTTDLTFKRLKSLDYLVDEFNDLHQLEEEYQQRDAALVLLSGELRQLIDDLMTMFRINTEKTTYSEYSQVEI